jgi:DsbC/DsbD-like thiol-disulfide interchange protein
MRLLVSILLTLFPLLAPAEIQAPKGVDVSLLSENKSIAAGRKFTVSLRIRHHEKFHTYWKNPGIAGVPTEIVWQLPAGFSAGEIQWPYPEQSKMAVYPVHGYERDVMLLVDITPPAEIPATHVNLKATASWMACADGCYPGKISLDLELPVSAEPTSSPDAALFSQARLEIPKPLEGWIAERVSAVDAPEIRFRLKPEAPDDRLPDDVYFFSSDGQISSDQPQRLEAKGGVFEIIAKRSDYSPKGKTSVPGVLVSASALGKGAPRFATVDAR